MRGAFIFLAALLSTPAAAETQFPSLLGLSTAAPRSEALASIPELRHEAPTPEEHIALAGKSSTPIRLEVEALAGHRSFTSMTERATPQRHLTVTSSNSVYGVGTAVRYSVPIAKGWSITPFASLDYNRVDSGRTVNKFSPKPFVRDNADTGLAGSVGAVVTFSTGKSRSINMQGFGAVVTANNTMASGKEFASVGAQVLSAFHSKGPATTWAEFGVRAKVSLAPRWQLHGAFLKTAGSVNGSSTAGMIGIRHRF